MNKFRSILNVSCALVMGLSLTTGVARSQASPELSGEAKIGFVFFTTGGAAAFGIHAERAAKVMVDALNAGEVPAPYDTAGIAGRRIVPVYVDEAGGAQRQLAEFRRLVDRENVDVVIGYNSSGDCNAIGPLAEELQRLTIIFYCGHQTLFEEIVPNPKYVFRTASHGTMDQVGAARYLAEKVEGPISIAGINQDYAHGHESWPEFKSALAQLKPDARISLELYPQLYAGEYGSEITTVLRSDADFVYNTFWGGDADAFVLQARSRNLASKARIVMTMGTGVIDGIGERMIPGTIIGARGPYSYFAESTPLSEWFREAYRNAYDVDVPPFGAYAAAQAILAYKSAVEIASRDRETPPNQDEIAEALRHLEFESVSGFQVKMALSGGHQAIQPTAYGIYTGWDSEKNGPIIEDIVYYPAECVNPPADVKASDWIASGFEGAKCE